MQTLPSSVRVYKKRIEALVRVWSEISLKKVKKLTRDLLVDALKKVYEEEKIEPIRGSSIPQDLYYKELAALYYVGLHGLGIKEEFPEVFEEALEWEGKVEEAFKSAISRNSPTVLKEFFGEEVDKETLVKMLRIPLTGTLLGFEREGDFKKFLHIVKRAYPKLEDVVRNYVRFYIALKVAESIASGKIKNKTSKEAYKRAMAIFLGFERNVPSDSYVYSIAREVYKISKKKLNNILTVQK